MSHTISVPDDVYQSVAAIAQRQGQPIDDVISALLAIVTNPHGSAMEPQTTASPLRPEGDPLGAVMRARGHLMEPAEFAAHATPTDLPPYGSKERAALLDEIGAEASDAREQLGMSVSDLLMSLRASKPI